MASSHSTKPPISSKPSYNDNIAGVAQFDLTFPQPNAIQINVEGAFIVDESEPDDYGQRTPLGTKHIALPHHTDEVSHIAVDVSI